MEKICDKCGQVVAPKDYDDTPVEDMFGSEIRTGDTYFKDQAGRAVLFENAEDYLIEVAGVEFFKDIK